MIHKRGEFRRYNSAGVCVSTNGAEGFFARVKRMLRLWAAQCVCVWGALLREPFRLLVWSDNCSWPLLRLFLQVTQKKGCLKFQKMLLVSFTAVLALGHVKFVWDTQVSSGSPRKAGLRHLHGREGVKRDHHVKSWNLLRKGTDLQEGGGAMRVPEGQVGADGLRVCAPFQVWRSKFVRGPQWRRGAFWQLLRVLRVETMPKAGVMEFPGREMVERRRQSDSE